MPSVTQLRNPHGAAPFEAHAYVNVEATDLVESATALEMAVKREFHPDIVRVLLYEAGASLARPSGLLTGGSLLHLAVAQANPVYVQLMLDCYADPDELDDEHCTPLFRALLSLKDMNFEEQPRRSAQLTGNTPCTRKDDSELGPSSKFEATLEIISMLLKYGAQPSMQSFITLQTQFHIAAELGLPPRVFKLLFGDLEKDSTSRANGTYSNILTSMRSQGSDSASMEWRYFGSETTPNTFHADNPNAAGEAAFAGSSSIRRQRRLSRQHQPLERFSDGLDGFSASVNEMPGMNAGGGDDLTMPIDHGMSRTTPTTLTSTGRTPKIFHFTDVPLAIGNTLLMTDAKLRTPLHYLCAHADRARQRSVLPTLLRILALPSSEAGSRSSRKDEGRTSNGGSRAVGRELSQTMCRMGDFEGRRPLHAACRAHFYEAVHALLEVDPEAVFVVDAHGNTPLHDCVSGSCYGYLDPGMRRVSRDSTGSPEGSEIDGAPGETRAAIGAVIEAVARAVRASIPHPLEGFPTTPVSWTHEVLEKRDKGAWHRRGGSITSEVEQFIAHSPFFSCPSVPMQLGSLSSEGAANKGASFGHSRSKSIMVSDWAAYMHLEDGHGRTALLLAGERGDTVAASALLRVSTVK
ncbi:unnamed protein product [Phytomonas sp. Hart1]|nr:unnamed protein product [Phytomonas sp. Hart1]|eukprot:CCW69075.1 unnamed protein product [Phytomonas sp. isolate Hart1]